ncbi:uncharacterized protein LOC128341156 [Hemicordylus capensis]|uniref:uncharacterized protein LOC128341156 n=1 Tax=Hemicordylus capensis TaxID=884348 RepID=UPI0023048C56|nr:uncharacterized protein LOC128341156 [Hemicordylus capensis]
MEHQRSSLTVCAIMGSPERSLETIVQQTDVKPSPRKRYISTSSDDEKLPPAKHPEEENQDVYEIWQGILEAAAVEPFGAQEGEDRCLDTHPLAMWNYTEPGNMHIRNPPAVRMHQPSHVTLQNFLELQVNDSDNIPARKRRSAMKGLVRAGVYGVLKYCLKNCMHDSCYGCMVQAGAQDSHECVTWTERNISRFIRILSSRMCVKAVLHIIIIIGYCLKMLMLTSETVDQTLNLITSVKDSDDQKVVLEAIPHQKDSRMLFFVNCVLEKRVQTISCSRGSCINSFAKV